MKLLNLKFFVFLFNPCIYFVADNQTKDIIIAKDIIVPQESITTKANTIKEKTNSSSKITKVLKHLRSFYLLKMFICLSLLLFIIKPAFEIFIYILTTLGPNEAFIEENYTKVYNLNLLIIAISGFVALYQGLKLKKTLRGKMINSYFIDLILAWGVLSGITVFIYIIKHLMFNEKIKNITLAAIEFQRPDCSKKTNNNNEPMDNVDAQRVARLKKTEEDNKIPYIDGINNCIFLGYLLLVGGFVLDYIYFPKITIKILKNQMFNPLKGEFAIEPNFAKFYDQFKNIQFNIYVINEDDIDNVK
jgi:hypothetical protein